MARQSDCPPRSIERQLPPNHGVPQGPFAGVVGRLDAFDFQKCPQPLAMVVKFPTHAVHSRVSVVKVDRLHSTRFEYCDTLLIPWRRRSRHVFETCPKRRIV